MEIKAFDLDEAWWACLRACWEHGRVYRVDKGSFEGHERKGLPISLIVTNPSQGPLIPIVQKAVEVPPPTDIESVNNYLSCLVDPTPPSERADYHYGEHLASQIPLVIHFYRKWYEETGGYGTNRLTMMLGNEHTLKEYFKNDAHTPCLRMVDTDIVDGRLNFHAVFRSWDGFGGMPVNLGGLQLLKQVMAGEMGVKDGMLCAYTKDWHLYDHVWDWVEKIA